MYGGQRVESALAMARDVQCVASWGGDFSVSATTVDVLSSAICGLPGLVAQQPADALVHEAGLPAPDRRLGGIGRRRHDRGRSDTVGTHEHDPGSSDGFCRVSRIGYQRFEPSPISLLECDGDPCNHVPALRRPSSYGIPRRTLPSRSIH